MNREGFILLSVFFLIFPVYPAKLPEPKLDPAAYQSKKSDQTEEEAVSTDDFDTSLPLPQIDKIETGARTAKQNIVIAPDAPAILVKAKKTAFQKKQSQKKEPKKKNSVTQTKNSTVSTKKTETQTAKLEAKKEDPLFVFEETGGQTEKTSGIVHREIPDVQEKITEKSFDLTNSETVFSEENKEKLLETGENSELAVSLEKNHWLLKSMEPQLLTLQERKDMENNTVFTFYSNSSGKVLLSFIRYDAAKNETIRQNYQIIIKPRDLFASQTKQTTKKTEKKVQNNKKTEKSEEDFRKILANDLFREQKWNEAKSRYESLLNEGKADAEIFYKMGLIEEKSKNFEGAVEFFKKTIGEKDNPYYARALTEILTILKNQKKYDAAIDNYYTYAISDSVTKEEKGLLDLLLSDIYFHQKDFKNAAQEYRRYMEKYPDAVNQDKALFYLAYSIENYPENPDFKEAYRIYQIIQSRYPESDFRNISKNRMLYIERHYLKID